MEKKFKTNINCNNCIRSVSGFINDVKGLESWEVDTDNPDKILTIKGAEGITADVIDAVEEAGYNIEEI